MHHKFSRKLDLGFYVRGVRTPHIRNPQSDKPTHQNLFGEP
ncbi:MAG: hypothetical protein QW514_05005 [Thermoprotei archaeon]